MAAQVGSLLLVGVHFVLETTKQVLADLGLIWSFKSFLQNGKLTEFGYT